MRKWLVTAFICFNLLMAFAVAIFALDGNSSASMSISVAKSAVIGTSVSLNGNVATTSQNLPSDSFYIQEIDRSAGILIIPPVSIAAPLVKAGDIVNVLGRLVSNGAELCILADSVTLTGETGSLNPLGMSNGSIGSENQGLLIRTWGRVTYSQSDFYYLDDGSVVQDESGYTGIRVIDKANPLVDEFRCVTGISGGATRRLLITPLSLEQPISDLSTTWLSDTQLQVSWTSALPTSSVVDVMGVIPVFRERKPASSYVQAIIYAPDIHGDALSVALIDQDLADVVTANANAINVYGFSGSGLRKADEKGCHLSLQEHLLAKCRELGLKVIVRLEAYDQPNFHFSYGTNSDAEWVISNYSDTLDLLSTKYPDILLYYLINMPLDDTVVRSHFSSSFPTARQQQDYAQYLCRRIKAEHAGAKVRAVVHYSVIDDIPVAPLMTAVDNPVGDPLDGVALVAYPARCNSCPFTTGIQIVSCSSSANSGDGPSYLRDPLNVIIGKDQLDYWLEKARITNSISGSAGIAMDGVGFAERLGHWSGIVADHQTKILASQWLADYLAQDGETDGFSYFMLHDKDEGSFGIIEQKRIAEPDITTAHSVVISNLYPGTKYSLLINNGTSRSQKINLPVQSLCLEPNWPSLAITQPGYGNIIASDPQHFKVKWSSRNLSAGAAISLYADEDDRGLNGIWLGTFNASAGSADVDLTGIPTHSHGSYYIYGTVNVSHCSVPNSLIWDYSPGRVINPSDTVQAHHTTSSISIDGMLSEQDWSNTAWQWKQIADHSLYAEGLTRVKLLWDSDYLYAAFDVDDKYIETDDFSEWDGDSVSLWLWGGTPSGTRTDLPAFIKESRIGPRCLNGSYKPLGQAAVALKSGSTCNLSTDQDTGYTVEMAIPWSEMHFIPGAGYVISADFLSVDHDCGPGQHCCGGQGCRWSKIFWDGDSTGDWLSGAIQLVN